VKKDENIPVRWESRKVIKYREKAEDSEVANWPTPHNKGWRNQAQVTKVDVREKFGELSQWN